MSMERVQQSYEQVGRDDPLWGVLSVEQFRHGKWDPDDFFQTGRDEIADVMDYLACLGQNVQRQAAFDFGCGVGRLTQALCTFFDHVVGFDISVTMVDEAARYNKYSERCQYVVNTEANLRVLEDSSFDLVYSNISLQHMAPEYQVGYISEFFRILKPQGVAVFQVRTASRGYRHGSLGAKMYKFRTEYWHPLWKRLRGRPPIQVHTIAPSAVEEAIASNGGTLIDVVCVDKRRRRSRKSLRYCATRSGNASAR